MNWGLGHAARVVPVIQLLHEKGCHVLIGAYGSSASFLKKEFPECQHVELKGFTPFYSKKHSQTFALFLQSISFLYHKIKEHVSTARIVTEYNIDLIISDNRYGVRNKNVPSVLITHQIKPELNGIFKRLQKIVSYFITLWIKRFDQCWIPDISGRPNLTGSLSENIFHLNNITYTGILSRFDKCKTAGRFSVDYLAIVSGPEPWRTMFEKDLTTLFKKLKGRAVIVRGLPDNNIPEKPAEGNIAFFNHLDTRKLNELICSSRNIICRSGYSTVMDLFATGRKALLIPTPNQPEQEFLAEHLAECFKFRTISQDGLTGIDPGFFDNYKSSFTAFGHKFPYVLIEDLLK